MENIVDINSKVLRYKNILFIPSVHSRAYFACAVREAFNTFKPDCVAVEHPEVYTDNLREAVSRLPYLSMIIKEMNDEAVYIPIDPCDSIIEAVRLSIDEEIPFFPIDSDITTIATNSHYIMPDDFLLTKIGLDRFYKEVLSRFHFVKDKNDDKREYFMAKKLFHLSKKYERVLCVIGMSHLESIKDYLKDELFDKVVDSHYKEGESKIYTIHKDSFSKMLGEIPFTAYIYELFRNKEKDNFNKLEAVEIVFREALNRYKLPVATLQLSKMMDYLRNLCVLDGYIIPDAIDMLTAAKCMINNEYALEVMDGIKYYPYYTEEDERYPIIKLSRNPITNSLDGLLRDKKIKLNRYDSVWKTSLKTIRVKTRPAQKYEGEWEEEWNKSRNFMSHIPEDVLMERYMDIIRDKIKKMLTEDKAKIEPFKVSIKDGIDMRETIRNYYKKEIYVKEIPRIYGNVGNMVFIFDDEHDDNYNWNIVWYSEAHDDSDLILYATEPGLSFVGPAISKCYFGGYASLMPPKGPHDVWKEYSFLKESGIVFNYADLLLYSGIIYSNDKYLGYVAPKPPSKILNDFAKHKNVNIVYIPVQIFSSETLRKLRHFHVLGGKRLRDVADKYIID